MRRNAYVSEDMQNAFCGKVWKTVLEIRHECLKNGCPCSLGATSVSRVLYS
jgi:hypothetical protein